MSPYLSLLWGGRSLWVAHDHLDFERHRVEEFVAFVFVCRYAHRQGFQLTEALIPAALHNHGSKKTQQNCGSCIRWLLAHRCPVPHQLDPTDLYIVSVKRHMLKERRTSSLAVLRQPSLSGLSSVPLSCCERILQAADLWTPATVPTALSGGFGRVKRRRLQSAGAEAAPALV